MKTQKLAGILFSLPILLVIASCENKSHEQLISFESSVYRDLSVEEYESGGQVEPKIIDSLSGDTLFISLIVQQAGCMTFIGNISIEKDTIYLAYHQDNDEVCDELMVYKMNYLVKNPGHRKYVILVK